MKNKIKLLFKEIEKLGKYKLDKRQAGQEYMITLGKSRWESLKKRWSNEIEGRGKIMHYSMRRRSGRLYLCNPSIEPSNNNLTNDKKKVNCKNCLRAIKIYGIQK